MNIAHRSSERGTRAVAHTVLNKVAIVLMNAGTGILTARILMPTGRGELAAMILPPIFLSFITTLGIPSSVIFTLRRSPHEERNIALTGLSITAVMSTVSALVAAAFLPLWIGRQYNPTIVRTAQAFLAATPIMALGMTGRAILESKGLFSRSNQLLMLTPGSTLLGLIFVSVVHRLSPFTAGLAYMLGAVPAFCLMIFWVLSSLDHAPRLSLTAAHTLLGYGIRSFGVDLLGTLALQVDQVLVISLLTPGAMGIYGVMLSLSRMFNLFQASVVMVLFPKATGLSPEAVLELTERSARISTMVTAACCLLVAVFGYAVLRLLYGKEYSANTGCLRLLLLEVTISGAVFILAQAFMALGRPGVVTIFQAVGLALSIPLMLWLIPKLGIEGAALSLLLSTIARFCFVYFGFRFILKLRPPHLLPRLEDSELLMRVMKRSVFG